MVQQACLSAPVIPFFFCSTGAWTQGLHLEPLYQPFFCDEVFWDRVSQTICLGWLWTKILLISASWVARIIGVSHQRLALPTWVGFLNLTLWKLKDELERTTKTTLMHKHLVISSQSTMALLIWQRRLPGDSYPGQAVGTNSQWTCERWGGVSPCAAHELFGRPCHHWLG
jgi:hypothetical protein